MLAMPEEIKKIFWQDNTSEQTHREWKLRFLDYYTTNVYPGESLFPSSEIFPTGQFVIDNRQMLSESLKITESLCESDELIFGECNATQFELTIADVTQDLTGKEFMVTVEVGGYELPMGTYIVDSFVRQADRRLKKITAYDRMRKFNVDVAEWYQKLAFPMSLKNFRKSLCDYIGIGQVDTELPLDDMQITKTIDPEQLNGLDVIQAVCEANGCFGHINRNGLLKYHFLKKLSADNEDVERIRFYKQSETSYENYSTVPIDRLQIRQEEGDIGVLYGDGNNTYVIEGNFLLYGKSSDELESIAAVTYENISDRVYKPCKITTAASPWLEIGDNIVCPTTDDLIETYCLKRTMTGIQGMMDLFESSGSIEYEENFGLQNQIIQLEGKAAIIKKTIEEVSVTLKDFKKDTESKFKITSDAIEAETKRAGEVEAALGVRADQISLSVKNLNDYTESQIKLLSDSITLKVSKGDVSNQLSVETGQIKISGNRLVIDTINFKLSANGTITCTNANLSGKIAAKSGTIGAFSILSNGNIKTSSKASIQFGNTVYIDSGSANIADWDFDEDGNLQGPLLTSSTHAQYWDNDGNLHATEIYIHDSWWKGWSLTETVEQLWNYVYNGGWNPCKEDCKADKCNCDAGVCLCDAASGTTGDSPCVRDDSCGSDRGCDDSPGCSKDGCGGDYPCHGDCSCHGPGDA